MPRSCASAATTTSTEARFCVSTRPSGSRSTTGESVRSALNLPEPSRGGQHPPGEEVRQLVGRVQRQHRRDVLIGAHDDDHTVFILVGADVALLARGSEALAARWVTEHDDTERDSY